MYLMNAFVVFNLITRVICYVEGREKEALSWRHRVKTKKSNTEQARGLWSVARF
jgi:hypothetical protein